MNLRIPVEVIEERDFNYDSIMEIKFSILPKQFFFAEKLKRPFEEKTKDVPQK